MSLLWKKVNGYSVQGEMMTAKKVWAIIIIVVGVVFFVGGIKAYNEAELYGTESKYIEKEIAKTGQDQIFDLKRYEKLGETEQFKGIMGALLGIFMAIGGTMLLPPKKKKKVVLRTRTRELDSDFPML
jgi:drug/metabolite transporter (DMT)-like permease